MQTLRSRPGTRRGGIIYLRPDQLQPNPVQPRRIFDDEALKELSDSIRSYGILNPLTVRLRGSRYELVAGERRLRAAILAGLREVPCILMELNMEDAGLIALVENLQRKDLDFVEEALGISQLIRMFSLSQEEAARRIGKSQSAVANKLRLLRLGEELLEQLRSNGLSERHGRALLRLGSREERCAALEHIIQEGLTVAATDSYIDALLAQAAEAPAAGEDPEGDETGEDAEKPRVRRTFVLKDVRIFLNTLSRSIDMMKQGGIAAGMQRQETEEALILTISIPKSKSAASQV